MRPVSRREILLVLGTALLTWVLVLVVLSRWQAARRPDLARQEPELVHYPGTEGVAEQESENLGWRKYWFTLDEPFPSTSVYEFYRNEMERRRWRLVPGRAPTWVRQESREGARDLFHATWLSPDRLYQLDLDMVSLVRQRRESGRVVSETREPGIRVYVTLRRVVMPGLLLPPVEPEAGRGEIEVR